MKYSPDETTVTVRARDLPGAITLEIHNWGSPIPEDRLEGIFQPLQRATTQADTAGRSVVHADEHFDRLRLC